MDLLLCDVMINHSCGLDFITSVKSRRPHLPIVVLTGANPAHWRQACEQAGSASYLRKPAAPQSIVRQVALIAKARLDVRVALIDKDTQHRVELTRLLDAMGCCIESYASAAQALPIASDDKAPAVWVADATDPDLLTLLGRIRVAETPVFAFRQNIDVQREEDLMRAGAAMFLSKPIDVETLLTQANLLTRQPNPQNT
jgi:DNA-binding NtrC family response regulator